MNKIIRDRRTMCYTVKEMLSNTLPATLDGMPMFDVVFNRFEVNLELFPEQSESQTMNRKGQAILKDAYKKAMATDAANIQARIKASAVNTGNTVLTEEMTKSFSILYRTADIISADLCMFIYNKAKDLLPSLATYGVTSDMVDDLVAKINLFIMQLPKPRIGIVERKESTRQIKLIMNSLMADLKVMDALVDMLRFSDEVFYTTYYSSRMIVNSGHRTTSIEGLVLDENGLPMEKVDVILVGTTIERKTSEYGGFEIKNLKNSVYKLIFKKTGYLDLEVEVAVTATMRTEVEVSMERDVNQDLRVA